jgi:hypothetical protein
MFIFIYQAKVMGLCTSVYRQFLFPYLEGLDAGEQHWWAAGEFASHARQTILPPS